jgi:hypothetical protein
VQIKVRGRDRSVRHPGLDGHWVNSARQPQASGRVPRNTEKEIETCGVPISRPATGYTLTL